MSKWELSWLAVGVSVLALVVLVAGDRAQGAMQQRRRVGKAQKKRRRSPPVATAGPGGPAGPAGAAGARTPMLVQLAPPVRWWHRLRAALGLVVVSAATGLTLAIGLGLFLFGAAFLLRQAGG